MKILHTSDWHLGHRLHDQSQFEEQNEFLLWLLAYIEENMIQLLLIAGDIFDTGVPSAQAQKQYYDFLNQLTTTNCKAVVIIGGNHDAPSTINAPKELLQALSIFVIGKATDEIKEEVFEITINNEQVIVAAVPYLRDQDIRRAIAAESADQINNRYKTALINHYTEVANYCESINTNHSPIIAMGHLFAIGGISSDSEQTIYVGNLGDIGVEDFPKTFDYVALGHLHRAQKIDKKGRVRYAGSPYILSFSEVGYDKKMILLETMNGDIGLIDEIKIPSFRVIKKIVGPWEECLDKLEEISRAKHQLTPWIELILDNGDNAENGQLEISKFTEGLNLEVLKIAKMGEKRTQNPDILFNTTKQIEEYTPLEVFELKCEEQNYDLSHSPHLIDAFHEILQKTIDNTL